ncbi:MAG: hypothetical protein MI924_03905 [Chloroflexales bacterium]|nr:hypothetical protein [Chloroflexales bacterium]
MMLRERSLQIQRQERNQRLALIIFGIALFGVVLFCAMIGWQILAPGPREIAAGAVNTYSVNTPQRFVVPKLAVSAWVRQRRDVSEDVVFVFYDQDGSWRAFLGMDTVTGCFLDWNAAEQLFVASRDPECLGARFTPDGRYLDGGNPAQQQQQMIQLPVETRTNTVVVFDQLFRPNEP